MKFIIRTFLCAMGALIFSSAVVAQGFNYAEVMQKSLFFYEAQRSGATPDWI
jgi:hypothetical protein